MTIEPPPPDQDPPREAPGLAPQSFGPLDGHIDALHGRICARVKAAKAVAQETILLWRDLAEIHRKGWYARYHCDSFFEYCDRLHDLSEGYVTRYCSTQDWRFVPGTVEGRPAIIVIDPDDPAAPPRYFILITIRDGLIASIRDFRYARYASEAIDWLFTFPDARRAD